MMGFHCHKRTLKVRTLEHRVQFRTTHLCIRNDYSDRRQNLPSTCRSFFIQEDSLPCQGGLHPTRYPKSMDSSCTVPPNLLT